MESRRKGGGEGWRETSNKKKKRSDRGKEGGWGRVAELIGAAYGYSDARTHEVRTHTHTCTHTLHIS